MGEPDRSGDAGGRARMGIWGSRAAGQLARPLRAGEPLEGRLGHTLVLGVADWAGGVGGWAGKPQWKHCLEQ